MLKYLNKKFKYSQVALVLIALCGFLFSSGYVRALDDTSQKILDLRKQIEELTKQAEQFKGTIAQKQKEANTLKKQIGILNDQISQLQIKINITDKQISSTKFEINSLEAKIFDTTEKITQQKQAIGELLTFFYERDHLSLLAALIKSTSLSDFTDQTNQAENLNDKLVNLLVDLKKEKDVLEEDKASLDSKKTELERLNSKQNSQKSALSGNKTNKNIILVQTQGQEAKYQQMLSNVEKKKTEFFQELQNLEAQALKSGAFIIHVTADSLPPAGSKIFKWPYDDYYISQGYGFTAYARRGAYGGAGHNGIDLVSGYGSPIRPIALGSVVASGFNNGFGNWIAIRHEHNVVSVYAHMRSPAGLANGTAVSPDSIVGYEGTTGNTTGSHLHLSLYKDFFTYINDKNGQLYFNYFEGTINPLDYL